MVEEKISVIIPIYKVEKYLDKCLESVVNQTYKNLEIILVDDGSPDNCPKICDSWAEKDSRIKVIHKKNGGLSDARNVGIENASGKYLMFVDSDDYVSLDICQKLYDNLIKFDADVSMCEAKLVYENAQREIALDNEINVRCFTGNEIRSSIIYFKPGIADMVSAWGKIYKKEIFKDLRFPVGRLHEDGFTYYKILFLAQKIVCTNEKLYCYLQRPQSIMASRNEKNGRDALDATIEQFEFLSENLPNNKELNEELCLHLLRNCYYRNRKLSKVIKKEILDAFNTIYNLQTKHSTKDKLFKLSPRLYCDIVKLKKIFVKH